MEQADDGRAPLRPVGPLVRRRAGAARRASLIGIDVLMRKFLDRSIGGADELAGYALAIGTAWGLGAALLDRAHIRIDSLYVLFPRRLRLALDLAALVLFVGLLRA